jgi:glycosyltransferase involved in cell wall biosynthesis
MTRPETTARAPSRQVENLSLPRVKIWNICPTHDPAYGGLYRGINDFAAALDAPIVSFDDCRRDRSGLDDSAVRIPAGTGPLTRDCHLLARAAAARAETAIAGADLLVVHSLFRAHTAWAAGWARRHGKRYWAVPHGCLDPWSLAQRQLAKRAWLTAGGKRYLAGASRVIFSTRRGLEKAAGWVAPGTGVALHWPVELPPEGDAAAARAAFRERHGIPADAPILLFVGRLHTVKRPVHVVEAFCRAGAGRTHLVVVGMDHDVTAAEVMRAVPASHRAAVHLVGPLAGDRLAEAYRAADGYLSLSFQENFGYAVAEAVAHGLPVILSPGHDLAYDMPRAAASGVACGWLVPDDSAAAAAQAISDWARLALDQSASLAEMGAAGRRWARQSLSPERFREALGQWV